jgi:hypothetical protein
MTEMVTKEASGRGLWKAVAAAIAVAAILLVTVVLPAEYGIDPTSVGQMIGLDVLNSPAASAVARDEAETESGSLAEIMAGNTVAAEPGAQKAYATVYASEETVISLKSLEEVEFKALMGQEDTLLYSWESDEPVYVDTHGEPLDYPDSPAVRYEERDGVSSGHGRITAPFAGLHGWYWLNTNETPITITLRTSGYYQHLDEVYRK